MVVKRIRRWGAWLLAILVWFLVFGGSLLAGYGVTSLIGMSSDEYEGLVYIYGAALLGSPLFMAFSAIPAAMLRNEYDSKRVFVVGGLVCGLGIAAFCLIGVIVR